MAEKIFDAANNIRVGDEPVLISAPKELFGSFIALCSTHNRHLYVMHSTRSDRFQAGKLQTINYRFEYLLAE